MNVLNTLNSMCAQSLSSVCLSDAMDCSLPGYMEFSRQENRGGLPFPSLGHLPDPGINANLLHSQADSLPLSYHWCVS